MNSSAAETRIVSSSWHELAGAHDTGAGGDRRRGGVSWTQAFAWNCGNQTPDAKGEAQAEKNREGETTHAREWVLIDLSEGGWPCNGAGAKGSGQVVVFLNQLETG